MRRSHISKSDELSGTLKQIENKIDLLIEKTKTKRQAEKREEAMGPGGALDIVTLLSLPDHHRKSAMIIMKLGKVTAKDVAKETGRARAIESAYMNQLARMGHVKKGRAGRRVYFSVEENQANVEYLLKEKVATVVG